MTAIWPTDLPTRFMTPSYKETRPDNVIYSEVSVGPAKARRRTTANVWKQSGTMTMSYAQYASFLRFLSNDIGDGASAFLFPNRLGGLDLLVRMDEVPNASLVGSKWQVTLSLEVLP